MAFRRRLSKFATTPKEQRGSVLASGKSLFSQQECLSGICRHRMPIRFESLCSTSAHINDPCTVLLPTAGKVEVTLREVPSSNRSIVYCGAPFGGTKLR